MPCNIEQLPIVIITQVIGRNQKAQRTGLETSELIPKRIVIYISGIGATRYVDVVCAAKGNRLLLKF